jgi:hypothetical protein
MNRHFVVALVVAALGAAGCMEVEQTASAQKQGKYQGKPDGKSWDNAPLAYGNAKWNKGDKGSWESQLKTRSNGQNEYVRIGH